MPELIPSLSEVDDFLSKKKEIDSRMKWKNKGKAFLEWSSILIDEDGISIPTARIILTANQDEALYRFSFVLYYRGINIRRLDIDDYHRRTNPVSCPEYPGQRIIGNHLHKWNPENGAECVIPVDMPAKSKTYEEWFYYYLGLVNLVYNDVYNTPPLIKTAPRLF
ncbi:MAG: hypothetical protein HZB67_05145 [Candidatus Aenigmarchaeota archaeon]|nr:hypothetical protein [Candidatus Aenigmarchaeota archaeon]MBI5203915.1 hypothetical protein [Nitrospirota bacterium]